MWSESFSDSFRIIKVCQKFKTVLYCMHHQAVFKGDW